MKRFAGLFIATTAIVAPATAAFATASAPGTVTPAEYRAECNQIFEGGKALFEPLIASPLGAVLKPLEAGVCGENKYA